MPQILSNSMASLEISRVLQTQINLHQCGGIIWRKEKVIEKEREKEGKCEREIV